jgi:O-6-methylguanine DNA methyltransferase
MSTNPTLATARGIAAGLHALREHAPASLAADTTARLGLTDSYVEVDGPIGRLFVAYDASGISLVHRSGEGIDQTDAGGFEEEYLSTFGRPAHRAQTAPERIHVAIEERVWGRSKNRHPVPLNLAWLPEFERQVLIKTLEIPRGEVRPYSWIAAELGRPLAVRAVGNALARNPVPFVVPCHRVVRSDGRIGNYGAGGPEAKRALLEAEGLDTTELEELPAHGVRFLGSDTTGIYCYPSCRNARRITPQHRVPLRSTHEAERAGYRACKVCRPVAAPQRMAVA